MLAGWAYGAIYGSSHERTAALTAGLGTTTIDADTIPMRHGRGSNAVASTGNKSRQLPGLS